MFIIPNAKSLENILREMCGSDEKDILKKRLITHLQLIATADVYYQNSRMLRGTDIMDPTKCSTMKIMTHDDFKEYLDEALDDIELVTQCIDAFGPPLGDEKDLNVPEDDQRGMISVTEVGPEYEEIKKRLTPEFLKETFPATHNVCVKLLEDPSKIRVIVDDAYVSWCMHRYIRVLDTIRIQILDNMTPAIEYVVNNINYFLIKRHLHSNRINESKARNMIHEMFFYPDFKYTCDFYNQQEGDYNLHLEYLMKRLITNIDADQDRVIVIAIYLAASYAMADIRNKNFDAECAKYVKDVLAKIK